jgi:hypothetical protein
MLPTTCALLARSDLDCRPLPPRDEPRRPGSSSSGVGVDTLAGSAGPQVLLSRQPRLRLLRPRGGPRAASRDARAPSPPVAAYPGPAADETQHGNRLSRASTTLRCWSFQASGPTPRPATTDETSRPHAKSPSPRLPAWRPSREMMLAARCVLLLLLLALWCWCGATACNEEGTSAGSAAESSLPHRSSTPEAKERGGESLTLAGGRKQGRARWQGRARRPELPPRRAVADGRKESRGRRKRGIRGHFPIGVGTDPTWIGVWTCHVIICGIFAASFILPPVSYQKSFRTPTRSPKHNFDFSFL